MRSVSRSVILTAVALGLILGVGAPLAASAADVGTDDVSTGDVGTGFWYFDGLHFPEIHADGWTGEGVKIAVIDSPINLEIPTLQGADIKIQKQDYCTDPETDKPYAATSTAVDVAEHGVNVTSLLVGTGSGYPGQVGVKGVAPGAQVLYWAFGVDWTCAEWETDYKDRVMLKVVDQMIAKDIDILSVSQGIDVGPEVQARLLRAGIVVVGAVSNQEGTDPKEVGGSLMWPGAYNGSVRVQSVDSEGQIPPNLAFGWNFDVSTNIVAPGAGLVMQGKGEDWQKQVLGNGTSLATPIVAGTLALVKQKYPNATNNQLLQSLIRNTGGNTDQEPHFDSTHAIGYGMVSATKMLKVDPSSYPDVQPFIIKGDTGDGSRLGMPSYDEIFNPAPDFGLPTVEPIVPEPNGNMLVPWFIAIGVGLLILFGVIILVVILAVRRSGRNVHYSGVEAAAPTDRGER